MSLKITPKKLKNLLNQILNPSNGILRDAKDDAAEIIAENVSMHGTNMSLPSKDDLDTILRGGKIQDIASGRDNVSISDITSLRDESHKHPYFSVDEERLFDLVNDVDITSGKVTIPPIDWVHREKRFVVNGTNGAADLIDDPHIVNFVQCWLGGFTMYNKGRAPTADDHIQGRDIMRSAALLSITDIMENFKNLLKREIER